MNEYALVLRTYTIACSECVLVCAN